MIKLYICDIETLARADSYEHGLSKLLPDRKNKTDQMRSPMDKVRSMGAGLLLDYCLKTEGIETYSIELMAHGKPYLKGENMPCFNLSHSNNLVVCGISDNQIGVDVQFVKTDEKSKKYANSIVEKHFTIEEQNYIEGFLPDKRLELFYSIWTGKESYMKMSGKGFLKGLDSFVVNLEQKLVYDKEKMQTYPLWNFQLPEINASYFLAACGSENDEGFIITYITVEQLLNN